MHKDVVHTFFERLLEYYSAINMNDIMPLAATWMDLEIVILSEVRERQISYDITYMWNLKKKKWYKWTYLQNRNRVTDIRTNLLLLKEKGEGRDELGDWDWHIHSAIYKTDNQQEPTV